MIINGSLIIEKSVNIFTGSLEEKGSFKDKEIKLSITSTPGFLSIGSGYKAFVFVDNELARKFNFH